MECRYRTIFCGIHVSLSLNQVPEITSPMMLPATVLQEPARRTFHGIYNEKRQSLLPRRLIPMNQKPIAKTTLSWTCAVILLLALSAATNVMTAQSPPAQSPDNPTSRRSEEIAKLLAVLRDPDLRKTHPEQVVSAIQRLGEVRAIEAVDDLIELLTFARKFDWESPDNKMIVEIQVIHTGNRYPATSALFQIGRPALPALVKVIELDGLGPLRGQNAMFAIQGIFSDDLSEGVKYLEQLAQASANPDSAQHLMQAAAQLKQLAAQLAATKK